MRSIYVVAYDISDPKRLRKVYETMLGWGDRIQLSVFRCDLDDRELIELKAALADLIQHNADQVLFIDIGPAEGRGATAFKALGRPLAPVDVGPTIV